MKAPRALMPLLLAGITAGFYWKIALTQQFSWLESPATGFRTLPALDFEAREVRTRRLGLWDQWQWGGQSLLARIENGATNPLQLPLFANRLKDGQVRRRVLDAWWVGLHWLATLAAYALCRGVGATRAAALLGACAYGFGGSAGATLDPQRLSAAVWTPVVLLMLLRSVRGERPAGSAALAGAALGLTLLSGRVEVVLSLAALSAGIWLYSLAGPLPDRRPLRLSMSVFAAVGLLVSGGQLAPAIAYGDGRWWRTPASVQPQPLAPEALAGALVVLMAAAGLTARWEKREARILAATAIASAAVAMSPWMASAVAPAQAPTAALAALGFDAWPAWNGRRAARYVLAGLAGAVLAVYLVRGVARAPVPDERPAMIALAALLAAGVLYAWDRGGLRRLPAASLLAGLVLLEAGAASSTAIPEADGPESPLRKMAEQSQLADYLKRQPGWFRVDADPKEAPYDFGRHFGIEQVRGASVPASAKIARLGDDERRRLFGMAYYIGKQPLHPGQVSLYEAAGLKIFRDGRGWKPLWTERDGPGCLGADELTVVRRNGALMQVDAVLACPATVVMGDVHAPGWTASVDGVPAPIREMHGVVRGVAAPAGRRRLELRYRPVAVYWGMALAAAGLLLAAALWWREPVG